MTFALVNASDTILRYERSVSLDAPVRPPLRRVPVVNVGLDVPFDSSTHIREGPVIDVQADQVVRTWTVRALTQAELDARLDSRADALAEDDLITLIRLLFEASFLIVNDVRDRHGQSAITAQTFVDQLLARSEFTNEQLKNAFKDIINA